MPEWILFLPLLVLPTAALVFALMAPRVSPRARVWLPVLMLALQIVAVLVNVAPVQHRIALSEWSLASFSLVFQIDGPGLFLMLLLFVVPLALWLVAPPRAPFDPFVIFVYSSAVILLMSGSLSTVYFGWVLLDVALFLWRLVRDVERETALRALAVSQLAGMLVFAGAIFANTPVASQGGLLIALALWARLGLFPFHWVLPMRGSDSRDLWTARGVPLIAAAGLWVHWGLLQGSVTRFPVGWISVLATVALLTCVVKAWHEEQPPQVVTQATWHAVALIPLAALYGGDGGPAYTLWQTLAAVLALAGFEMALRWRAENRNHLARWIWIASILVLAGMPLTPAFVGRIGAYAALLQSGAWWFILVAGLATAWVLIPLWNQGLTLASPEPRTATVTETAGLSLFTLFCAVLGLVPMPIAQSLADDFGAAADVAFGRLVSPEGLVVGSIALLVVVVPVGLAYVWRKSSEAVERQSPGWIGGVARVLELGWLARLMAGSGFEMSRIARATVSIVEENPTIWLLLVALWIAIFVLLPR